MADVLQKFIEIKWLCIKKLEESPQKSKVISETLKGYNNIINSRRAIESINSVLSLIKILEKRDCLSYRNVEPLLSIAQHMDNSEPLIHKIHEYEKCLQSNIPEQPNYYDKKPIFLQQKENAPNYNKINIDHVDSLIYEVVSKRIGTSWRVMARHLDIQECVIDTLEREHRTDMVSIVHHLFNSYRRLHPKKWKYDVCKALEKSRRTDLKDLIENIIIDNE